VALDAQHLEVLMNILVIQTAFLGDAILTLPLIDKLHEKFPLSKIDVVSIPATLPVFQMSPFVTEVFPFDKKRKQKSFISTLLFGRKLRKGKYDLVFSPHRSSRSAILAKTTGAELRFAFDKASLNFFYTDKVKYRKDFHEVKRNLSLVCNEDEIADWKKLPQIVISDSDVSKAKELIKETGNKELILLAPGSVWETKKWPLKYFAEIASTLNEKGFAVGIIGGKEDYELGAEIVQNSNSAVINFCGKLTIPQSVALIREAALLVTNDSAPTHMGVIADTKVLTIYTSTIPGFGFYPYNAGSSFLSLKLPCKPCGIHGWEKCPLKHFDCGNKLKPDYVLNKIEQMLQGE
jgi:heptosyltransferase-2